MLVLTRRQEEKILIGDNITIKVVSIGRFAVKIGIDAPKEIRVDREEVRNQIEKPHEQTTTPVSTNPKTA